MLNKGLFLAAALTLLSACDSSTPGQPPASSAPAATVSTTKAHTGQDLAALKQRYAGHAKRAALIAAANSYMGRLVVVVDDDVDPSNLADVMWAITTRCEPAEQIDIVRNAWSSALDPRIPDEAKRAGITSHSKAIIEAVRPFGWKDKFPPTSALTSDEAREIEKRWAGAIAGRMPPAARREPRGRKRR